MSPRPTRTLSRLGLAVAAGAVAITATLPATVAARRDSPPTPVSGPPTFELTVLHVNDGESALLPTEDVPGVARFVDELQGLQAAAEVDGTAGLPAQASPNARRAREPRAALTISAGDNFLAGPLLEASLQGDTFYDALVYVEADFDAMTIGNHEFDFGPDVLARFIEEAEGIPFLSSNLDVSDEPSLAALEAAGRIAPSTVVEKDGRRIGVVGATTPELPVISSPRNVVVEDVLASVQAEVDALTADGVGIILLSSHLQNIQEELALVTQLRNVDAVIGGGGGENIRDQYPLTATDADGKTVPVVTTPGAYTDIGQLVLRFDRAGNLLSVGESSALLEVPFDGPLDTAVLENVEAPVADFVADLAANVLATSEVPLDGRRQNPGVRNRETNLGSLLADSTLAAARARAASFGVPVADVAFQNGGGIRNESIIGPGPVTELDTFAVAPFANFVSVATVNGVDLKLALERSVAAAAADPNVAATPAGLTAGGFHGQWANVRFNYEPTAQRQTFIVNASNTPIAIDNPGSRIWDAIVTRADGTEYQLVDDGVLAADADLQEFTIASSTFIFAGGGDAYFSLDKPFTTLGLTYQQGLAERIEGLGTITAADYPDVSVNVSTFSRFGPVSKFPLVDVS